MKSDLTKVLHPILGRPIIGHVLTTVAEVAPEQTVIVVGHQRERITQYVNDMFPDVHIAVQDKQHGTGHAVRAALDSLDSAGIKIGSGPTLVLAGDTPLLTPTTLHALLATHVAVGAGVTALSAVFDDPAGYGRIIRDEAGVVLGVVEHKDATEAQRRGINEVNSSIYVFSLDVLRRAISKLGTDNAQGEEYLTDVLAIARESGTFIQAHLATDVAEVHGINDRIQLAAASQLMRGRIVNEHMRNGVTIIDPASTWIEAGAVIDYDVVIHPNCHIDADSRIGARAVIGPDTTLQATVVAEDAHVLRSHCLGATVDSGASVGPFTFLRPRAHLRSGARVGAYVEVKNSTIGVNAKVPHLSYVGDADIGTGTNIGAATIFVNYDGVDKHRTTVGDHVRIGSDTMLVGPVEVGDGAYTAAGSVVTDNVPPGAMAIGRAHQTNIEGWVEKKRPGTASAKAASAKAASTQAAVLMAARMAAKGDATPGDPGDRGTYGSGGDWPL